MNQKFLSVLFLDTFFFFFFGGDVLLVFLVWGFFWWKTQSQSVFHLPLWLCCRSLKAACGQKQSNTQQHRLRFCLEALSWQKIVGGLQQRSFLNDKRFLVHSKDLTDLPICSALHREGMEWPRSTQKALQKSDFQCIFSNSRQQTHNRYLNNNPCKNLAPLSQDALFAIFSFSSVKKQQKKKILLNSTGHQDKTSEAKKKSEASSTRWG